MFVLNDSQETPRFFRTTEVVFFALWGFFFLAETRLLFKCGKGDGYCTCETFERG